jgi:glycosyltransferase involved in cell wall biosynthesis
MKEKLKIVAIVHGYFPNHNAGAEAMLHQILHDLKHKGHEIRVVTKNPGAKEYEGIPIYELTSEGTNHVKWSDIVFTQLDLSRYATAEAIRYKKKIVHLVHNDKQLPYNQISNSTTCSLAIANSEWIRKTIKPRIPSLIVYPPTIPERYEVKSTRESITIINMNEAKGGKVFWQLARMFPDKHFIGVLGAYGKQVTYKNKLKNVTILKNTTDIQSVYKQSRIVLMPSTYESWGRVAMEASCSGIPVIASPTPGLKESLDYAGIFAEPDDIADWFEAINLLDDEKIYDKYSKLTKKRSKEVAEKFQEQMENLEKELVKLVYLED